MNCLEILKFYGDGDIFLIARLSWMAVFGEFQFRRNVFFLKLRRFDLERMPPRAFAGNLPALDDLIRKF